LPQLQTQKYSPRTVAGLQCRPLQAKGKAYAKILLLFRNFIVGASIARPPLPRLQPQKHFPAPLRACNAGPYKQKARLMQKFYRSFKISSHGRVKTPALLFGWQTAGAAPGFSL